MKTRVVSPKEIFGSPDLNLSPKHYIKGGNEVTMEYLYKAIQQRCLDCLKTEDVAEVYTCCVYTCPLYPHRLKGK